jgi:hypothetical protein
MQIEDLVKAYSTKTDEELVQLAEDSAQLTPEARAVLTGEITRRRLDLSAPLSPSDQPNLERPSTVSPMQFYRVGEFVAEVLRVYHSQFWLFVKLMAPAVVVGYFAISLGRYEARELWRDAHRGVEASPQLGLMLEGSGANLVGWFTSWMAFCVSFGAICPAVGEIEAGSVPRVLNSFRAVRERSGSFFRLSLLLFFLCAIAFAGSGLSAAGAIWLSFERHFHLSRFALSIVSFVSLGSGLLVLSRFALAIPAVILDDYRVRKAMFRSDQMTQGKWLILAALLSKSLIGGYVAGMVPFWLASWIPASISLPSWFPWILRAASVAAVTVVEPTMFIGFGLLYLRMSVLSPTTTAPVARRFV